MKKPRTVKAKTEMPNPNFKGVGYTAWGSNIDYIYNETLYKTGMGRMRTYRVDSPNHEYDLQLNNEGPNQRWGDLQHNIFIVKDYIYFNDHKGSYPSVYDHTIYKVHIKDPTKRMKIVGGLSNSLVDGWLYYIDHVSGDIARIKTNGKEKQILIKKAFEIKEDYSDTDKERLNYLYSLVDSTQQFMKVDNGNIYYTNPKGFFKFNIKNKTTKEIWDTFNRHPFYILNDEIYYDNAITVADDWGYKMEDNKLCCKRIGSKELPAYESGKWTVLKEDVYQFYAIIDGWIYYRKNELNKDFYKIKVDGTKDKKVKKF